jgi:hypothetical protein
MIDALIKRVSVTYKCYEMYAHRGKKVQSTTAHESVKIISTKWFMHISHLIFVNIFLENLRQHFRVFVYKSNLYFFSYEIAEFRIQELFEPLFKEK